MGGVLGDARRGKMAALSSLEKSAQLEGERERANATLKANERSQKMTSTATGAIAGGMIGAKVGAIGGPAGAVGGAAFGYILSEIF